MEKTIRETVTDIPTTMERKRVAAYARVSSGKDAIPHSLSAQVCYYSNLIQCNPKWIYVGTYVDRVASGTRENRESFQRLLADCRAGKVDMVITKSTSRLARNTATLLKTVCELKTLGIDVYFEDQQIHTMSKNGDLLITILASFAQEESRGVSKNRRQFESGEPKNMSATQGGELRGKDHTQD